MVLAARDADAGSSDDRGSFIEELVVRRELSMNYVAFEPKFDTYEALLIGRGKLWSNTQATNASMFTRRRNSKPATPTMRTGTTPREMVHTGFMHNYMRMYWAKKILEWSATPKQAYVTTLALNNKYFLDGRDPNSYANVAWCYGLHDRAWTERPVFGKIRYMNANGLNRKFDMNAYTEFVDRLVEKERR